MKINMLSSALVCIAMAICIGALCWAALVIVHDYGQSKYVQGYSEAMKNCAAERLYDGGAQ